MSKMTLVAKLTVKDGEIDAFKSALGALISAADEEDGLEVYACSQSKDDPQTFWFFELYASDDAFAVHGKGEAMGPAMAALGGHLAARPEVTLMDPVVAKGLDFG